MRKPLRIVAIAAVTATVAAGCSSSSTAPASSGAAAKSGAPKGSGDVKVLYAGSLVKLMETKIGPDFEKNTGYSFTGFGAGSTGIANQIKGKVRKGDVFISASPKADKLLEGDENGNWVSWYITFGSSKLVLGINPNSKFATDLKTKPWFDVITRPGFKVGFTDPKTDPKGKFTEQALLETGKKHPALNKVAANLKSVFPEESLVADLQSGQLDAGFFYTSEAKTANIATVPLAGVDLGATYTVAILKNAPNAAGATAFVKYLLGPQVQSIFKNAAFTVANPPKPNGPVPAGLLPQK